MANYKEKIEELRRSAEGKVRELDEKFGIREKLGDSAKIATDAARAGGEVFKEGAEKLFFEAEKLRAEAEKMAENSEFSETTRRVAADAAQKAKDISENLRETAESAGARAGEFIGVSPERAGEIFNEARGKAGEFFGSARETVENAARQTANAFNFGLGWTRIFNNTISGLSKAATWTQENPWQAVGTSFSVLLGLRLGSAMPFLSTNWLPNSALPVWGLKKRASNLKNI